MLETNLLISQLIVNLLKFYLKKLKFLLRMIKMKRFCPTNLCNEKKTVFYLIFSFRNNFKPDYELEMKI